jgi:hypothetical protein
MNWTLYLAIWGALALSVPVLAVYRKWIATDEDDSLCVSGDGSGIEKQKFISHKLEGIDRWGKMLTVLVLVLGLVLLAMALGHRFALGARKQGHFPSRTSLECNSFAR